MYLLYSILLTIGVIALLPRFALDAFRHGKYVAGWRERMGRVLFDSPTGEPVIWLHCVSVGETQAARPLVKLLRRRFPTHTLVVSTTTLTGQRIAREVFADEAALVFYFPYDWRWTVRRTLKSIRPALVVDHGDGNLAQLSAGVPPAKNSNSDCQWPSFRALVSPVSFNSPICRAGGRQSRPGINADRTDAERMRALSMSDDKVKVTGNIKFDTDRRCWRELCGPLSSAADSDLEVNALSLSQPARTIPKSK